MQEMKWRIGQWQACAERRPGRAGGEGSSRLLGDGCPEIIIFNTKRGNATLPATLQF